MVAPEWLRSRDPEPDGRPRGFVRAEPRRADGLVASFAPIPSSTAGRVASFVAFLPAIYRPGCHPGRIGFVHRILMLKSTAILAELASFVKF
jgi:hypothetical protein